MLSFETKFCGTSIAIFVQNNFSFRGLCVSMCLGLFFLVEEYHWNVGVQSLPIHDGTSLSVLVTCLLASFPFLPAANLFDPHHLLGIGGGQVIETGPVSRDPKTSVQRILVSGSLFISCLSACPSFPDRPRTPKCFLKRPIYFGSLGLSATYS